MKYLIFLFSFNLFAASEFATKSEEIKTKISNLELRKDEYCQVKDEAKKKECSDRLEDIIKQKEQIEMQELVEKEWVK